MANSKRLDNGVGMIPDIPPIKPESGKLTEQQVQYILDAIRGLRTAVNGNLRLGNGANSTQAGNLFGHTKVVFFKSADTNYEVPYDLGGEVAIGILQLYVDTDDAVVRAADEGSWTPSRMFVRCNVAGTTARFVVV